MRKPRGKTEGAVGFRPAAKNIDSVRLLLPGRPQRIVYCFISSFCLWNPEKKEENQQTLPCGCLFGCFSLAAIK